jgi:hypothetical protein
VALPIFQGIAKAIKEYASIQSDRAKITGDVLVNQMKEKQNFFYKLQEMQAKSSLDWEQKKKEYDYMKTMNAGQGGQDTGNDFIRNLEPNYANISGGVGGQVTGEQVGPSGKTASTWSPATTEIDMASLINPANRQRFKMTASGVASETLPIDEAYYNSLTRLEQRRPLNERETQQKKDLEIKLFGGPKRKEIGTGKTLISPQIDKISKNEDAYYSLGNSLTSLEANKEKFKNFMGPANIILRNPARAYFNKDLQDFLAWKANVQDAFQQYRVAVTGAQASDKEINLLARNRPTENDTYEVFTKKTNEVRKIGNSVIKRYITNLGKAGYDVSGYQDTLTELDNQMRELETPKNFENEILPEGITNEDIQVTLQRHPELTKETLLQKIRGK